MLDQLYLYLIIIGLTIGLVLLYLRYRAGHLGHTVLDLIQLNEKLGFDLPDFLRQAWPLLREAGMNGMQWELDWFGLRMAGSEGKTQGVMSERVIAENDMRLQVRLYGDSVRGEKRYFHDALVQTFFLLLRTDLLAKAGATDASTRQMARLNLFLQHDMKNLAQFIQLMDQELREVSADEEGEVIARLREVSPLVRQRADKIVSTLTGPLPAASASEKVDMRRLVKRLCILHRLDLELEGQLELEASPALLDAIFDNIFKNFAEARSKEELALTVQVKLGKVGTFGEVFIGAPQQKTNMLPERMFEPFWSSRADGLGIGLYQARALLLDHGGELSASLSNDHLRFRLSYPLPADVVL